MLTPSADGRPSVDLSLEDFYVFLAALRRKGCSTAMLHIFHDCHTVVFAVYPHNFQRLHSFWLHDQLPV